MSSPAKILVVDDNVDNVELLTKRLRAMGYRTCEAYDGEQALARVETEDPDLIILDVMMPKIDGYEVCRRLKASDRTRMIPVLMLTAKREVPEEEKRVTEERLDARGQMAEGVAHEVRNPMVAIGGFARRIRDKLPPGDPLREYAERILKEVRRLETMVEEIVRFKTLMISPYEPVDLRALADRVIEEKRREIEEAGLHLERRYGDVPEVQGDPRNLRLALANLLDNSVEATPSGGMITVAIEPAGDHVRVEVRDTGRGIPRDELANVFDPFYTTKMAGAGMGLTTVHRIVTRHGGEIDIDSQPGQGTSVVLTLPVRQSNPI